MIDIGEKVLIFGLFGKDYYSINNKIGIVNSIMFSSCENSLSLMADVLINNQEVTFNFDFL